MGTIGIFLLLIVFGIILYINLLSDFNTKIQDTYQSNPTRDDDGLPEENDILNDVFNQTLGVSYHIPLFIYHELTSIKQFEKIFAINLPERSDRRDSLSLAAAVSNISLEFIDGVHGDSIPDRILPPSPHTVDRKKETGAIGCWASHIKTLTE